MKYRTLPIDGKSFVQAEFVVIVGISGRTDLAMRSPCGSHGATTICLSDRPQLRRSGSASATDCLQETIADPAI